MSKSINQIALSGELDRDSELRATPTGTAVCTCVLTVVDEFQQKQGPLKHFSNRFQLTAFSRAAEELSGGRKGDRVIVSGSLGTETSQGQDGKKSFRTIVKVSSVIFLDPVNDEQQDAQQSPPPAQPASSGRQPTAREMAQKKVEDSEENFPPF